jgi:SNF2 family DNA or RNA helicase
MQAFIPESVARILKPWQVSGLERLWEKLIVDHETRDKHAEGCVLAHTMGAGKTLQVRRNENMISSSVWGNGWWCVIPGLLRPAEHSG